MKAVALIHYLPVADPEAFLDVDLPKPAASDRDLLVAVKACPSIRSIPRFACRRTR